MINELIAKIIITSVDCANNHKVVGQAFKVIHVRIMFIRKAVRGLRSFVVFFRLPVEVASAVEIFL